jgi:nucleotide-binding universal stress UspA family protein
MPIHTILVPVDYSEHSKRALLYAAALAEKFGASLDVVHVWDRPSYVPEGLTVGPPETARSLADMIRENAEREMQDFLREANVPVSVRCDHRLVSGDPAHAIVDSIATSRPDLVVVGTHGRTGVRHLLLGSVAEKLVRLSPVPVLTIPPAERGRPADP